MSAYVSLMTPMTDRACLLAALADLGFGAAKVEVHEAPVALVGYRGDARAQQAEVVIRRQQVGPGSNDIGFAATPLGYRALISDYDRARFGASWLAKLSERYGSHQAMRQARLDALERERLEEERRRLVEAQRQAVHAQARKMGYRVAESREGEKVRLVLVKRSY